MQGAISLGNEKPHLLGLTEKALWRSFMQASLTGDSTAALNGFIAEFQELHTQFNGPEMAVDWYSESSE
jgi:hypothetical protein